MRARMSGGRRASLIDHEPSTRRRWAPGFGCTTVDPAAVPSARSCAEAIARRDETLEEVARRSGLDRGARALRTLAEVGGDAARVERGRGVRDDDLGGGTGAARENAADDRDR